MTKLSSDFALLTFKLKLVAAVVDTLAFGILTVILFDLNEISFPSSYGQVHKGNNKLITNVQTHQEYQIQIKLVSNHYEWF